MEIDIRKQDGVSVLVISGRMGIDGGDAILRETFQGLLDSGERYFVFDLRRISALDSAGLGEIIACHKRVARLDGGVRLVMDRPGRIHDFFATAHLDRVFTLFETVEQSVESYASDPVSH